MKGRLYMIMDKRNNELDIVSEIECVGDNKFVYESKTGAKIAYACNILEFTTREEYFGKGFEKYCNDLNTLITDVWKCKFNPHFQHYIATFSSEGEFKLKIADPKNPWAEKYNLVSYRNLEGTPINVAISDTGRIIAGACTYTAVEWDKYLSASSKATLIVRTDAFKYIVTYQDYKGKPSKGYSKMANYISNYISAFPEGISSRDIECGLKLGHPTIAGRISEMDNAGRITKIGGVRYCTKGKENSIWVISKE